MFKLRSNTALSESLNTLDDREDQKYEGNKETTRTRVELQQENPTFLKAEGKL